MDETNEIDLDMFESITSMYIIDDDEMKYQQNFRMIPEDESAIIMESENDEEEETSYFEEYCEYK